MHFFKSYQVSLLATCTSEQNPCCYALYYSCSSTNFYLYDLYYYHFPIELISHCSLINIRLI